MDGREDIVRMAESIVKDAEWRFGKEELVRFLSRPPEEIAEEIMSWSPEDARTTLRILIKYAGYECAGRLIKRMVALGYQP